MRKILAVFGALFLTPFSSAHAGLYHVIVEEPFSVLPAVLVTLGFVALVAGLEHLRKKEEK